MLIEYGLSPNEAKVYLAMLLFGHNTVLSISQETEIKRPTVYITLEGLLKKGLAKIIVKGKKKTYLPEEPEKLVQLLETKKRSIEEILPELKNNYFSQKEKPKIISYEGKDGIRKIYRETLRSKTEVLWFGSVKDIFEEFMESFETEKKRLANPNGSREIINNITFDKSYAKRINAQKNPKERVKILPNSQFFPSVDNIIYEDRVVILSVKKNFYGVVIENSDIANAYRTMFELAWKSAVEP
ncbi:MAG TPA: helix-turn-helix domain-containing protein [Candidatus Moranbacteria bacterium]|nr:helix-turn-helix domain-containing protein [Candidatus Moranbacteria bacterium]